MRKIGSLPSKTEAERFRWILKSQNIAFHTVSDDEEEVGDIWIESEDDLKMAKGLFERFKEDANSPEFERLASVGQQALAKQKSQPGPVAAISRRRSSTYSLQYPVTKSLMALSIFVFMLRHLDFLGKVFANQGVRLIGPALSRSLRFSLYAGHEFPEILSGQIWRLFTPMFLHEGWIHILFNMLWLWTLGQQIEENESPWKYVGLVLAIAIPSHVVYYLVAGPGFGGMSGVNYGLFSYIWFMDRFSRNYNYRADEQTSRFFLVWYVLCLVLTIFGVPVANTIHGVGAAMGILVGFLRVRKLPRYRTLPKTMGWGCLLLLAGMCIDFATYPKF